MNSLDKLGETSLNVELTATARSEITKLIQFITNEDSFSPELKALALATTSTLTKTVDYLAGADLPADLKTLALQTSSTVIKLVQIAATANISDADRTLLLIHSGTVSRAIEVAAGRQDPTALAILSATNDTVTRMIEASGGALTPEIRSLLDTSTAAAKIIEMDVDGSAVTAFLNSLKSLPPITIPMVGTVSLANLINTQSGGSIFGSSNNQLGWTASSYLAKNPDIAQHYYENQALINSRGQTSVEAFAKWQWDNYGYFEGRAYAKGGAFTNGVVSSPTMFDRGLMGEAGPEAIMPLTRTSSGDLGVRLVAPEMSQWRQPAVTNVLMAPKSGREQELMFARSIEVQQAQHRALMDVLNRLLRLHESWDRIGTPPVRDEEVIPA